MATENYCSSAAGGSSSKRLNVSRPSSIISSLRVDEDLLVEILIRLPGPKSVFRCKSVSRRWNALISAPYFSRRFVSHHRTPSPANAGESEQPVLIISHVRQLISSFLPFPHGTESKFSVLDSVKDLLLIGFWGPETTEQELRRTHLVCNPFTKQWVALPLAPKMAARLSRDRWIVKLVLEPFNSSSSSAPREFRVVRMYNPMRGGPAKVDVYTFCSRSGRWTKSVLRLDADLRCWIADHRVVSTNGKLYWLNSMRGVVVKWDPPFCQLDYGMVGTARFPVLLEGCELDSQITSCYGLWVSEDDGGDHVHMVCNERMGSMGSMMSVWRLVEDEKGGGGCWRKQYEVAWSNSLSCARKYRDGNGSEVEIEIEMLDLVFTTVVGVHSQKSEVVFVLALRRKHPRWAILSWNFRSNRLEFVTDQDGEAAGCFFDQVFQPRVTLWPTLIASRDKLGNAYDWKL